MNVKDKIRGYVTDAFLKRDESARSTAIRDDDDLFELLDSLQILRMASDLENAFSIRIDNGDLTPENFGSLDKLADFVARKRTAPIAGGP
jgi:acyl carrier protein